MLPTLVLALLIAGSSAGRFEVNDRTRYPYVVEILWKNSYPMHNCGGVLINAKTVLTRYACIYSDTKIRDYSVVAGNLKREDTASSNVQVRDISKLISNPYILCMAITKSAFVLDDYVNIIKLPTFDKDTFPHDDDTIALLGWGGKPSQSGIFTYHKTLRRSYGTARSTYDNKVIVDAPNDGASPPTGADGGGPMVLEGKEACEDTLIGIFVETRENRYWHGVYVPRLVQWIENNSF